MQRREHVRRTWLKELTRTANIPDALKQTRLMKVIEEIHFGCIS